VEHATVLETPRRPFATVLDAHVGDVHVWSRTFEDEDIERTGDATRDRNPIHFDAEYAAKTRFKRPILHGVATIGEISRALGMDFPGRGTIFVSFNGEFKRPIYPGDTVHFKAEIKDIVPRWKKLVIAITATVLEKIVFNAEATVVLEDDMFEEEL